MKKTFNISKTVIFIIKYYFYRTEGDIMDTSKQMEKHKQKQRNTYE